MSTVKSFVNSLLILCFEATVIFLGMKSLIVLWVPRVGFTVLDGGWLLPSTNIELPLLVPWKAASPGDWLTAELEDGRGWNTEVKAEEGCAGAVMVARGAGSSTSSKSFRTDNWNNIIQLNFSHNKLVYYILKWLTIIHGK